MQKTYHGSCDCGKVTYEATMDLSKGTFKCNCGICTKGRLWGIGIEDSNLKVITGESELTSYWTGPIHYFCRHCGIKVFGKAPGPDGKKMAAIMLLTLDDLDPKELMKAPVHYFDGRHDRFDRQPDFKDHL